MKMKIIDNAINKVFKVEAITVSPEQMARLVETRLIPICDEKELARLKKGMEKTWVIAVGQGSSIRYYPNHKKDVKICLDFNLVTHQLSKLSLLDFTDQSAKKEFVLPKGSKYNKQAQQLIMKSILALNSANIEELAPTAPAQQAASDATQQNNTVQTNIDAAEELKKYKELLDGGIITQQDFDLKKQQLLNS